MSSSISSSLPPSLKKINVFLKRAEELDRDKSNPESRVVAYNCRQYAVLQGIPLAKKNATSTEDTNGSSANKALGQLLDTLETEKHAMSVFSKNEHWKICRKVADRVFDKADSEDRAGVANKGTARGFYAAGTFYEILQQFHNEEIVNKMMNNDIAEVVVDNDVDEDEASVMEHIEEENQRRIYCKWKATDILNAIKEGRAPTPGGYQHQKQENEEIDENNNDGGGNVVEYGVKDEGIEGDVVPLPPPSVPSSDLFELPNHQSNTPQEPPPPSYDGIELNLSGQPTTTTTEMTTTETSSTVEKNAHKEMFIPPPPSSLPPPHSYSQPPPPPPPPQNDDPTRNNNGSSNSNDGGSSGKGMFSSIFHNNNNKSSINKKLSKEQMGDVIELTKFALAALQNGDGELGRERLEQALAVWR